MTRAELIMDSLQKEAGINSILDFISKGSKPIQNSAESIRKIKFGSSPNFLDRLSDLENIKKQAQDKSIATQKYEALLRQVGKMQPLSGAQVAKNAGPFASSSSQAFHNAVTEEMNSKLERLDGSNVSRVIPRPLNIKNYDIQRPISGIGMTELGRNEMLNRMKNDK